MDVDVVELEWAGSNVCIGMANGSYMFVEPLSGVVASEIVVGSDGNIAGDRVLAEAHQSTPPAAGGKTKVASVGSRDSEGSGGSTPAKLAAAVIRGGANMSMLVCM